jgi:hypothetical protein
MREPQSNPCCERPVTLANALTHNLVNVLKSLLGDFRKVRCILGHLEGVRQRNSNGGLAPLFRGCSKSLSPSFGAPLALKWDAQLCRRWCHI